MTAPFSAAFEIDIAPVDPNSLSPVVRLFNQGKFVKSFPVHLGNNLVGRDPSNQIYLDSSFVSRHHFMIEWEGEGKLRIQDLKSRNGTFLNRQKVTEALLSSGDRISCGPFEFHVCVPEAIAAEQSDENTIVAGITRSVFDDESATTERIPKPSDSQSGVSEALKGVNASLVDELVDSLSADPDVAQNATEQNTLVDFKPKPSLDFKEAKVSQPSISPSGPIGLEPDIEIPATVEADATVLPDRVVLKKKQEPLWLTLVKYATAVVISAIAAYSYSTWKNTGELPFWDKAMSWFQGSDSNMSPEAFNSRAEVFGLPGSNVEEDENLDVLEGDSKRLDQKSGASNRAKAPSRSTSKQKKRASVKDLNIDDTISGLVKTSPSMAAADRLIARRKTGGANKAKDFEPVNLQSVEVDVVFPKKYRYLANRESSSSPAPQKDLAQRAKVFQDRVRANMAFVQECYVNFARKAETKGQIELDLGFASSGAAKAHAISMVHYKTKNLELCLQQGVSRLSPGKPPWAPYRATYRFKFAGKQSVSF